ncbi:MAG: glycosyltransferase [Proteobacteria bacterium]|nr:glycosyltransferase [Pseudomonadota bacterium]
MAAVDIVMPVYNGAEYLEGALASLSEQSFTDLRIIISDNASTDATPAIIAAWQARDPRIIAHRQSENIGALANFNWVLQRAESPWVMFACHDDLWSPDYVAALYTAATAKAGTWLAAPSMTLIHPDQSKKIWLFDERVNAARGLYRVYLSLMHVTSGWYYGLYDRQALLIQWQASQGFQHAWGGDFIVLLPFLLSGRVRGNNAATYYKRETPLSAARYKPKTLPDQFDLYRSFLSESLRALRASPLPLWEQLVVAPLLLIYTNRHAWKLRRLIRSAILRCLCITPP